MAKTLIVNNTPFEYPTQGEDPNWAEGASEWAEAVSDVLLQVVGPGDIVQTNYPLTNNQVSVANINGFVFNSGQVKTVTATYRISRTDGSTTLSEKGNLELIYNPNTTSWDLNRSFTGDYSGVVLNITALGQVQYTSDNFVGQTEAFIRFETLTTIS